MACGSVAQAGRDLTSLNLTRGDLSSSSSNDSDPTKKNSPGKGPANAHEAIVFLQKEHSEVLSGLHQQVEDLQRKCDDLQFELHLRHVTSSKEETIKSKMAELTKVSESRKVEIEQLKRQLQEQKKVAEDERQKNKWREVQLEQKLDMSEKRNADLKLEISKLKSQLQDMRRYCSSLRKLVGRTRLDEQLPRRPSLVKGTLSRKSSLESSSGLSGMRDALEEPEKRVAKNGNSSTDPLAAEAVVQEDLNLSRSLKNSLSLSSSLSSVNNLLQSSSNSFLPPLEARSTTPRPSSSLVTLPPIPKNASQPKIRRQQRLLSAPAANTFGVIKTEKTQKKISGQQQLQPDRPS